MFARNRVGYYLCGKYLRVMARQELEITEYAIGNPPLFWRRPIFHFIYRSNIKHDTMPSGGGPSFNVDAFKEAVAFFERGDNMTE